MAGKKGGVRGGMSFAQRVRSIGRKAREAKGGGPAARGGKSDVTNPAATASDKEYGGMGASKGTKKSPPFSNLSREYDSLSDSVQRAERNKGTRSRYHKVFSIRDKKSPPPTRKQLKAVKKGGKAPSDAPERVGRGKYVKPDEATKKARQTIAKAKKLTPAQRRKNLEIPVLAKGGLKKKKKPESKGLKEKVRRRQSEDDSPLKKMPAPSQKGKRSSKEMLTPRIKFKPQGRPEKNPVKLLNKGGFPDLTGDGKVTKKDVLKGRGVAMNMGGMKKQYGSKNYMYGGSVMGKKKK